MSFSVDGWNEEGYKQVRRGGDFRTVLSNIEYFLKEKKRANLRLPITRAACVLSKFTYKAMDNFSEFWKKRVDMVEFQNFQAIQGYNEGLRPPGSKVDRDFTCYAPWQQVVIRANGDVLPCCCFYATEFLVVGNIKNSSLYEIWNSKQMKKIRKELLNNNFSFSPACKLCFESFYTFNKK